MADCPDTMLLADLVDGVLEPERAAAARDHAHGCDACRETISALMRSRRRPDAREAAATARISPSLARGTRVGPYEILSLVGSGGMGEVYRARDTRLQRDVAIKVLPAAMAGDPAALARFEIEARAASALNHPNVLSVHDVGKHDGKPYVVVEMLEGETLRARLEPEGLPVRRVLDLTRQIAAGLTAAHERGIVHRDLKPENLYVTSDGMVKILDFGLAKLFEGDRETSAATQPGTVLGTVGYMAPEQLQGEVVDHRADIFSLGVIVHEMLAGRRPFGGATAAEVSAAILRDDPEPLDALRPDVGHGPAEILRHCMEKRPADRFQSARDLVISLDALLLGSRPANEVIAKPPRRRRMTALVVAATAVAGAAVGVTSGWLLSRTRAPVAHGSSREGLPVPSWRRLTYGHGPIVVARFAPGEAFVFDRYAGPRTVSAYLGRLDGRESRVIIDGVGLLGVSRGGELAVLVEPTYVGDNVVSHIGVLARNALTGAMQRRIVGSVVGADWAPDGRLAALQAELGHFRLSYPIDRPLVDTRVGLSHVRVSPAGDKVAFIEHPYQRDDRGFVSYVDDQGTKHRLSEELSSAWGLSWSPSGDEIWYTGVTTGTDRELRAVSLSGAQRPMLRSPTNVTLHDVDAAGRVLIALESRQRFTALVTAGGKEIDLNPLELATLSDLSEDGKSVLLIDQSDQGASQYRIYLARTDASPPVFLCEGAGAAFAHDGSAVLVTSFERPDEITRIPIGVGLPRAVVRGGLGVRTIVESFPDGRRITFAGGERGKPLRLYVRDLETGDEHALSEDGVSPALFAPVSPDGKWVAGVSLAGELKLYPSKGGAPRAVKGLEPEDTLVRWTPDGTALMVKNGEHPPARIVRVDLATGQRTLLREIHPASRGGLVQIRFIASVASADIFVYDVKVTSSDLYLVTGLR